MGKVILKLSSNLVFLRGFLMMKMEEWKKQRGQEGGRRRRTEREYNKKMDPLVTGENFSL